MMVRRVLIANRGEIARRIIRTCNRLRIESVAVCAPSEYYSPFTREATFRHEFESDELSTTFLSGAAILEIANTYGVDSIHPGYGFLSENADFAETVAAAGLTFIGPSAEIIRQLGEKHRAIELARSIGVPTVPGLSDGEKPLSLEELASIGYPLMIKAAFGGGGRGMRLVHESSQLEEAVRSARRESKTAFGREEIICERYIHPSRHIEVQLIGDKKGNLIHLFERDCSFQRRYQKVIEEAPAPGLDPALRRNIIEAALSLGRTAGLNNAATVEFMLSLSMNGTPTGEFFFMEVNPRLQVEHTVTEEITGLDIVELQLIAASGEALPINQDHVLVSGHAIQVRVCSEIPERNFAPAQGIIRSLELPAGTGIRVESSLEPGTEISGRYDSLLLKVIAQDLDRERCATTLRAALLELDVGGISNNRDFLARVLTSDCFNSNVIGPSSESFLSLQNELLTNFDATTVIFLAFCAAELSALQRTAASIGTSLLGFRSDCVPDPVAAGAFIYRPSMSSRRFDMRFDGLEKDLNFDARLMEINGGGDGGSIAVQLTDIDNSSVVTTCEWQKYPQGITLHYNGVNYLLQTYGSNCFAINSVVGELVELPLLSKSESKVDDISSTQIITAPLPGRIIEIRVAIGTILAKGDTLMVLESMKTEHFIYADRAGIVREIHKPVGVLVKSKEPLISLE
jgi:3-methylcrotonyl-CoA carboxylase alpha subunit